MIERALDEGAAVQPRAWLEALEPRRMMSAGPAVLTAAGTFGDGGTAALVVPGMVQLGWANLLPTADGAKFYVTGSGFRADDTDGTQPEWIIARFNADGTPDTTFGQDGTGSVVFDPGAGQRTYQAFVQGDGKVVVIGQSLWGDSLYVGRFNADGAFDPTFNDGQLAEVQRTDWPGDAIYGGGAWAGPGGSVVLSWCVGSDLVTERLDASGHPDAGFGAGGRVVVEVDPDAAQTPWYNAQDGIDGGRTDWLAGLPSPDGSGGYTAYVALWSNWLNLGVPPLERVQIGADGSLVAAQIVPASVNSVLVKDGVIQGATDDGVVMAADGSAYVTRSVDTWQQIEKIGPDGLPDRSFGQDGVMTFPAYDVWPPTIGPDGKLYVLVEPVDEMAAGGPITGPHGTLRLNADGSIDPTFNGGQPAPFWFDWSAMFLSDGSAVVADDSVNGVPILLAQVGADGSLPDGYPGWPSASDNSGDGGSGGGVVVVDDDPVADGQAGGDPGGQDDGGQAGGPTSAPALLGRLDPLGNTGDAAATGFFDPASGSTVWDPQGTPAVYA